jgi:Coenzyme PQQ synthesis protein D (PqqD).
LIKHSSKSSNIFELRPKQLYPSELVEKGKVVVLVPESQSKLVEWFLPKKNKAPTRVKLDLLGSFVWDSCDGTMTVRDIADKMKQEYGVFAEPVDRRVSSYIKWLHTHRFIDVDLKSEEKSQFYTKNKRG